MSLNEEKDGEDPSKQSVAQNVQDELVRVIHMSLSNIATQVDYLNKHAEGILGALSKEVDKVSCRYDTLQDRVTQLNNNITVNDTEKEFPLQAKLPKSSQSASIQTDLQYPFFSMSAKICETHDVSVQTSPLYMSNSYCQDHPLGPIPSFHEDTKHIPIPYHQDDSIDLPIPCCQDNEQDIVIPCGIGSVQSLAPSRDISYCFKACEEKFVASNNEQVQERFRRKTQYVDHPFQPKSIHQITLMENDIAMGHIQPTCIDISPRVNPPTTECSAFSSYPIKEISKALTQAVGKVLVSPPCLQRKEVKHMKNRKSYVRYGVGKREMNPQPQFQFRPKPEVFVNRTASVIPPSLPHDWLTVLKDSNTECPASNIHSQTQFPSPILRTSAATQLCNCIQSSSEMGVKTTEEDNDDFSFLPLPPECFEIIEDNTLEEDDINERMSLMSHSPVQLRRSETKRGSDLLVNASFVQSASFDYLSSPLFPQSPRLSTSNSPRSSVLSTPRFLRQPQKKYICPNYSKTANAALPRHSTLETNQNSFPLSESFFPASVHSPRCQSAYSPKHPFSSRHSDTQSSRFSIPSSGKICIDKSTEKLVPSSPTSSSLKSAKPFTLQSLFSFPKSSSSSIPSPQTLSVFQYSADPMSPDPNQSSIFNKERGTFLDSITKGVLLRKTEEHCILKAQIEISKK